MNLILTFTFQYMIFLTMAFLLNPANTVRSCQKEDDPKIEKHETPVASENTRELLHGEILFRY